MDMDSLTELLSRLVADAFAEAGYAREFGAVGVSDRPDLAQFQCNGALAAAKAHRAKPRAIAEAVVEALRNSAPDWFSEISIAGPGFINLRLKDARLGEHVARMAQDERFGCAAAPRPLKVVIDYGGPNVAKPMHVGHLRSALIGESLKRIGRFVGHDVIGDVHLGDWGLQMGMLIVELELERPELPYFDAARDGDYPAESPVTMADLQRLYPAASLRAKSDPAVMEAARRATQELQAGRPGYRALWRHFVDVSVEELRADYESFGVSFDLWLGESDTQEAIPGMVARLEQQGFAYRSEGALVVDVGDETDRDELPPLILVKSDGAAMYGTTDLATIAKRVEGGAELILYVVDNRQAGHFRQVFRAAKRTGIAPERVVLEHVPFGTMNGKDGKPFKTREGGVMRLKDLIEMITDNARQRMTEADVGRDYDEAERERIARDVGLAALKYADLMNYRAKDYVFDLDRFSAFEGRTGPYLLYAAVRIRSILRKAEERNVAEGALIAPASEGERALMLELAKLPDVVDAAFAGRAPNHIAEYAYQLATMFNRFYQDHHILREEDRPRQASWLRLSRATADVLQLTLGLLGLNVPERM